MIGLAVTSGVATTGRGRTFPATAFSTQGALTKVASMNMLNIEHSLVINSLLVKKIGLNGSIVLHRLHDLLRESDASAHLSGRPCNSKKGVKTIDYRPAGRGQQ